MKIPHLLAICLLAGSLHAQSILTTPPETDAQHTARVLVETAQASVASRIGTLRDSVDRIASASNPQAVLDALGPHAGELLSIYQAEIAYLTAAMTASGDTRGLAEITAIAGRMPAITVANDGTATIDPTPSPTPTP